MKGHLSRRTKCDQTVSMSSKEVDQRGIASLKNIFQGQGYFWQKMSRNVSITTPHLLSQRAAKEKYALVTLHIARHNEDNFC